MITEDISIVSLLLAGFLSVLTPSAIVLIPPYLAYLSGSNPSLGKSTRFQNIALLLYALMFISGFALIVIVLFGAPGGFLGGSLGTITELLVVIGGTLLILFAIYIVIRTLLQLFWQEKIASIFNPTTNAILTVVSCIRSAFFGMVLATIWTPVIGPLLGTVLTLAIQGQNVSLAMFYLLVYSIGLAIPFIIIALLFLFVTSFLRGLHQYIGVFELSISVLVLFITGLMLLTGMFTYLNTVLIQLSPSWLIEMM